MNLRKKKIEDGKNEILSYLKKVEKATLFDITKALNFTNGKTQTLLKHLMNENKIYQTQFPDFINNKFKVYYSFSPLNIFPNTIPHSSTSSNTSYNIDDILKYYTFLKTIFNIILTSEKNELLIEFIAQTEYTIEEIIEMQKLAEENEQKIKKGSE